MYNWYDTRDEQILTGLETYNSSKRGKQKYNEMPISFDIETTSTEVYLGVEEQKVGIWYAWTMCFDGKSVRGRSINSWLEAMLKYDMANNTNEERTMVVWVHNLSFEFQFIKDYFKWDKDNGLFIETHKPVRVRAVAIRKNVDSDDFESCNIEFRCSYMLSGYSLANLAKIENLDVEKLVGDLDYEKIRHENTLLTDEEWNYIWSDGQIVTKYINKLKEQGYTMATIPYTATSFVRQFVRGNCLDKQVGKENNIWNWNPTTLNPNKDKIVVDKIHYRWIRKDGKWIVYERRRDDRNVKTSYKGQKPVTEFAGRSWDMLQEQHDYHELMKNLTLTPEQYDFCKKTFMGGFTHGSSWKVGSIFEDVTSMDFTSSYPSVMFSEKFPMSSPKQMTEEIFNKIRHSDKLYMCHVILNNVSDEPFPYEHYLSESRTVSKYKLVDNGRIIKAESVECWLTNLDLEIIEKVYKFDNLTYIDGYYFEMKDYLPTVFVASFMTDYYNKTTLKGVEGRETEYMRSKGRVNSYYGMSVTDILHDFIYYDSNKEAYVKEEADVVKAIEDENNKDLRFTFYCWGLFITAYSRRNLWSGILSIGEDYLYSDTDSIKMLNYEKHLSYFEDYNADIKRKMEEACKYHGFDLDCWSPKTIKGEAKPLGYWDYDGHYKRFKTLGAKRYFVQEDDDSYHATVAGVSKQACVDYLTKNYKDPFDGFDFNLAIPEDETGKMYSDYIDGKFTVNIVDYNKVPCKVTQRSCLYLGKSSFNIELDESYIDQLILHNARFTLN